MESCIGFISTRGSKQPVSWIHLAFLTSMLSMWTSVHGWSYYYSDTMMDWGQARAWCKEHYTDMVAIQNQEEIEHLNTQLPRKPDYYWIGIRKIHSVWTWVGTNKTLTDEAANWAKGEPNNGKRGSRRGKNEDCVEMYIKRDNQAGKWNDERCTNLKTALCYTAACNIDSCINGDCVETINNHTCDCYEGFYGEKCEHAVKCNQEEVPAPNKGRVNCTNRHGDFTYDSLCQFSCDDGYQPSMSRPLRCTAWAKWSEGPPTCELVQCPSLSSPARASMKCSDPMGPSSFRSTCVFACDDGYILADSTASTLQCEASGRWNATQPSCIAVQCPDLQAPQDGIVSCGDDPDRRNSYRSVCSFSCAPGFRLEGASRVTCTSAAQWSEAAPRCEAITCQNPEGEAHLISECSKALNKLGPNSTCSFSCDTGFKLQGAHTTACSGDGQWSEALPTCTAKGCAAPAVPAHGEVRCSLPPSSPPSAGTSHPLGMVCAFSCEEGHELQGAPSTQCTHPGQWSSRTPSCTAVRCPVIEAPEHGEINCSTSEPMYNTQCYFTCNQDYSLDGHELLICGHHGNWTGGKPSCQAPAPVTAIAAGVTAGGAALLSGLSLAMWILKRLRQRANKFELNSNSDIEPPPQVYKNSIDSLI